MKIDTEIRHVTKSGANLFLELGFAPADFEDLSEADRLSRDGFEQMDAGVSLAGDAVAVGVELIVPLEYETVIVAPATPPTGLRFRPTLVSQLLAGQTGTNESGPQLVLPGGLPEETFVIASSSNLGARDLSRLCKAMESEVRSRSTAVAPAHLARIETEFHRVRAELCRHIASRHP